MRKVSKAYKQIMDRPLRNRGYIQVALGVLNQEAQGSSKLDNSNVLTYYSKAENIFNNRGRNESEYATFEQNYMRADGTMYFVPEENEETYYKDGGIVTTDLFGSVKIDFNNHYDIKGLTLYFGSAYPTALNVEISDGTVKSYVNDSPTFTTTDVIGDTSYIIVTPTAMVGGQQRFHLKMAMMGVGLTWGNAEVQNSTFNEYISAISAEVSNADFSVTILDPNNEYNVDNPDSFLCLLPSSS